jgi:hypothetical protein
MSLGASTASTLEAPGRQHRGPSPQLANMTTNSEYLLHHHLSLRTISYTSMIKRHLNPCSRTMHSRHIHPQIRPPGSPGKSVLRPVAIWIPYPMICSFQMANLGSVEVKASTASHHPVLTQWNRHFQTILASQIRAPLGVRHQVTIEFLMTNSCLVRPYIFQFHVSNKGRAWKVKN